MILKRLAQHIRKQDWFVVTVEIMIVVIGIFIGLQVDDWNEHRKNIALERQYLERMQSEFDRLLEVEEGRLRWNEVRIAQSVVVEEAIDQQYLPEDRKASFEWGLYTLGVVNRPRLSWGTVDELRSTGNIQFIRDLALRQALTDMENEFRWRDRFLEEANAIALDYRKELNKHYRIVVPPHEEEDVPLELEYDLSEFRSNDSLRNMIARLAEYQKFADRAMRENLDQLRALRDQIAEIRRTRFGDA